MDYDDTSAPTLSSKSPKTPDSNEDILPSPKRQRTMRVGRKYVDYDMKHHPMDDVLRPKAAAKRRSYNKSPDLIQYKIRNEDEKLDVVPKPIQESFENRLMITPEHRRITRAGTLGGRVVDYDMKHHPMDDVLRPKATAKRRSYDQPHRQLPNYEDKEEEEEEEKEKEKEK